MKDPRTKEPVYYADELKRQNDLIETIAGVLERIIELLEKQSAPALPPPSPPVYPQAPQGYTCYRCGQWVKTGTYHSCVSTPAPRPNYPHPWYPTYPSCGPGKAYVSDTIS